MSWINQYQNLTNKSRWLLVEASVYLTFWQLIVKLLPFKWYHSYLGERTENPRETVFPSTVTAKELRKAIYSASKYLPWNPVCFPQALAAKSMLKRRRATGIFYFGASGKNPGKLIDLHVWLNCEGQTITGGKTKHLFTIYRVYH